MKYLFGMSLFALLFCGCCNNETTQGEIQLSDSAKYRNLILNAAMACPAFFDGGKRYPYYRINGKYIFDTNGYRAIINTCLNDRDKYIYKLFIEVKDSELGLTMQLYTWFLDVNEEYPCNIVYVKSKYGFEYAFPFYQEAYSDSVRFGRYPNSDDSYRQLNRDDSMARDFEYQLNHVVNWLNINGVSDKKKLRRFLSLLEDSLFHRSEITLKDSDEDRKLLQRTGSDFLENLHTSPEMFTYQQNLVNSVKKNAENIIRELRTDAEGNVLYFVGDGRNRREDYYVRNPYPILEGTFWKFHLYQIDNTIHIKPECSRHWFIVHCYW